MVEPRSLWALTQWKDSRPASGVTTDTPPDPSPEQTPSYRVAFSSSRSLT